MENKMEKDSLLAGLKVLDLADEKAGFCSKLLADMGARVIKIEDPGGDRSRKIGPFWKNGSHPERSLSFLYNNTNKLGVTLDLEHPDGRDIFFKLVKKNDVLVESFPPGHLEELGLGFDVLSELNRGLILVSVSGFGQNGPRRDYKSCDLVASGFGGQMYVTGSPSLPPLKHYGEQSYVAASLFAAVGILLALRNRTKTGEGRHLDISLQEAVTSTLEHVMIRYFYEQVIPQREGSLHWNHLFFILPCKDGSIQMSISQGWETLVEWIADEDMAEDLKDKKWRMEEYRRRHVGHIIEVLERWTKTHTTNELFELGQLMRLPLAPVHSPGEVLESPQLKERGFFIPIDHPEMNTFLKYPGLPVQFGSALHTPCKRAPLIGEDNAQVYKKELGLSEKELKRLSSLKVI